MKTLLLHCNFIEFTPIKQESQVFDEYQIRQYRFDDLVVLFVCVEQDDDDALIKNSISDLLNSMANMKSEKILLYPYSHLSNNLASVKIAHKLFHSFVSKLSTHNLSVDYAPFGWNKQFIISVKGHPLAEQFKSYSSDSRIEKVSQALKSEEKLDSEYFIMDSTGTLIPFPEFDFQNFKQLATLSKYEMSTDRIITSHPPHVNLMKKLEIADYEIGSDQGNLRYYPKGRFIKSMLEKFVTDQVKKYGAFEVETPIMYDSAHPSLESYLNRFPARQYKINSDNKELFLRFSACFGQFLMLADSQFSYKQLPLKIYELTKYSFRREKSGELVGLRRLRAFTMPDCHAFVKDIESAKTEILKRFILSKTTLNKIGLLDNDFELAIRLTKDFYQKNKDFLVKISEIWNKPIFIEIWSEKFFYFVFKWEFNFIDNLGKSSALSTDQIDIENAERYGITYVDEKGNKAYPIILHNSPSGAIERCIYALLEKAYRDQTSGKIPHLPFWLSPTQLRIIPLSREFLDKSIELSKNFEKHNVRFDIDDRDLSVGKKVRDAEKEWIKFIIVIGQKELDTMKFSVRDRENKELYSMSIDEFIHKYKETMNDMISDSIAVSKFISDRPKFV